MIILIKFMDDKKNKKSLGPPNHSPSNTINIESHLHRKIIQRIAFSGFTKSQSPRQKKNKKEVTIARWSFLPVPFPLSVWWRPTQNVAFYAFAAQWGAATFTLPEEWQPCVDPTLPPIYMSQNRAIAQASLSTSLYLTYLIKIRPWAIIINLTYI